MKEARPPRLPLRIAVVDSGFGGMNVVAAMERRATGPAPPAEIIYINAAPSDAIGYNQLGTRGRKLSVFRGVLDSIARRFDPAATFIACNSLAALLAADCAPTPPGLPTPSLVDLGAGLAAELLSRRPSLATLLFGTPTTIETGALEAAIRRAAPKGSVIISHACPGLQTYISNHPSASDVLAAIRPHARAALATLGHQPREVAVFLGCTHYGYRASLFQRALQEEGVVAHVLDPNEAMATAATELIGRLGGPPAPRSDPDIRFWSRYPLPPTEISTISGYLQPLSPASAAAVRGYHLDPSLFPFEPVEAASERQVDLPRA